MEYFVTGATGFLGSHLVEQLVERGDEVVALTRDRSNAADLPADVTVVEGDITTKESIREPMDGVDGVFHLAGWYHLGSGPWQEDRATRLNVRGTRNVLELVDELGLSKAVYTSTLAVNSDTHGKYVDESYRYEGSHIAVYDRTKWKAHYEVAQPMAEDGVPIVIVQPGVIYGPGDTSDLRWILWRPYLQEELPAVTRKSAICLDYVEDAAHAHVLAMERGDPGEEYITAGSGHEFVDLFELCEEITGVPAPREVSPLWFRAAAPLVAAVEPHVRPPEGFESEWLYRNGGATFLVDNTKAHRELGVEHRSVETGMREYLSWELDQLGIQSRTPS